MYGWLAPHYARAVWATERSRVAQTKFLPKTRDYCTPLLLAVPHCIVSDGPTHRLPMENRPCKHGSLTTTIPPVSDGVHARMRPTSGLLVLALASGAGLSSQVLGTLSGWPPCLLCLPMRACAQPGLAVRAVSAIGAHLELAGRLGMVGLGILRSPAAVHALGLRAEGNFPAVLAHRSKNSGAAWFGSPPSRHPRSTVPPCHS